MNIYNYKSAPPDTASLPHWLQITVAIASVISATAVFIYLIQLFTTKNQFEKQFKLSNSQFKTLNQGFLTLELTVSSVTTESIPDLTPFMKVFSGISFEGHLTNLGNMPIKCKIEGFTIDIANPFIEVREGPMNVVLPIYPRQTNNIFFSQIMFPNNLRLNYQGISDLGTIGTVKMTYTDFNDDKIKTINRTFLIAHKNGSINTIYTSINDTM